MDEAHCLLPVSYTHLPKIEGHEEVYEKVFEIMEKHDIECLFYAGGNDSMDTVKTVSYTHLCNILSVK